MAKAFVATLAILGLASTSAVLTATAVADKNTTVTALKDPNFCPYIAPYLPSECQTDSDCDTVKCGVDWDGYFAFTTLVELQLCAQPASLTVSLALTEPISDSWSHTWGMDESEQIPVPGASIGILGFDAGLVVDASIGGSLEYFNLAIALDVCADFFEAEYCGSDLAYYIPVLADYIPFVLINDTFDLSDECYNYPNGRTIQVPTPALRGRGN